MTAKDLLHKYLDYDFLWANASKRDSKPAMARLEQIESLLDAFGLCRVEVRTGDGHAQVTREAELERRSSFSNFKSGHFLHERKQGEDAVLEARIIETMDRLYPGWQSGMSFSRPHWVWLFQDLMRFRKQVHFLTYGAGGMLEGFSAGLHYSFYLRDKFSGVAQENLAEIDETLWLILDPAKRDIALDVLVRHHGYVDHDLDALDWEWRKAFDWD